MLEDLPEEEFGALVLWIAEEIFRPATAQMKVISWTTASARTSSRRPGAVHRAIDEQWLDIGRSPKLSRIALEFICD
jgi:hypothetical protein